jgi:hypothetical protein
MLGANFGRGVKIVAADRVGFAYGAVVDLAALVDAEGADVNDAFEFSQSRSFQDVDRAENIIGRAGVRILLDAPADQTGGVHQRVDVEFFHGAQQRRQIAHVGGDDAGLVFADDFLDVVAIGREIEKHDLIPGVDGVARGVGSDQTGPGDENVHLKILRYGLLQYVPVVFSCRKLRSCQCRLFDS